jgi:S-adenosylmethionine synthetase
VACETLLTTGLCIIAGEITTSSPTWTSRASADDRRDRHDNAAYGFDHKTCAVISAVDEQSADIAMASTRAAPAIRDVRLRMPRNARADAPADHALAHKLTRRLEVRKSARRWTSCARCGRPQVTVEYENDVPRRVTAVVVSTQHSEEIGIEDPRRQITKYVVEPVLPEGDGGARPRHHVNPTWAVLSWRTPRDTG